MSRQFLQASLKNMTLLKLEHKDFLNEVIEELKGENLFVEPFDELWKKLFGTGCFILQLLASLITLSFVAYEWQGNGVTHRTVFNQLRSWILLVVSF